MTVYALAYYTHVSCVVLSGSLFLLRGIWMMQSHPLLEHRLVRVLPHLIDTLLLGAAISLAWQLRQYPFSADWITVKVILLIVYIGLGMIALRRGRTKTVRISAFVLALLVFGFIVSVAITKQATGWFG